MKRFAIPLYAGFVAYFLSSILLGPSSPSSMRALGEERAKIQANLDELKRLNEEFRRRVDALRTDAVSQALEARSLGYLGRGERLVLVNGLPSRKRYSVAGKILACREAPTPGRALALPIGVSVFALAALASVVFSKDGGLSSGRKRSR